MNLVPDLSTPVIVTAGGHPQRGKAGQVTGFHGRLTDMVYVAFNDDPGREYLISLAYIEEARA